MTLVPALLVPVFHDTPANFKRRIISEFLLKLLHETGMFEQLRQIMRVDVSRELLIRKIVA